MDPATIEIRLGYIRAIAGDPEAAHPEEDRLHRDVLRAIADGNCSEPRRCAEIALRSLQIEFPRWAA